MSTHAHRVSPRTSGDVDDGSPAAPHCLNSLERHSRVAVWGLVTVARALLALAGSSTALGQCHYTYVEIPNPPGWTCHAKAINNQGWVVGLLGNAGDYDRAFIWTAETGTAMLPLPPGYSNQTASDINDHGHVVGNLLGLSAGSVAYLWDGVSYTFIEHPPWATAIAATGINNQNQIVGTILNNLTGPRHAFRWQAGIFEDLGALGDGANSQANSINELGQIFGNADIGGERHALRLGGNFVEWLPVPPEAASSQALNSNNNSYSAGYVAFPPRGTQGAVWGPGGITLIPPPPETTPNTRVTSINTSSRAVGYYFLGPYDAFVWQNGDVRLLREMIVPSAPHGFDVANDINDSGQIIGDTGSASVVLMPEWVTGDLTGDCHVELDDLALCLSNFGLPRGSFPRGDVDLDGDVDLEDLALLLSNWGT